MTTEQLENEIAEMEKQFETLPDQIFEKKNTLAEMRLQEGKEKRNESKNKSRSEVSNKVKDLQAQRQIS